MPCPSDAWSTAMCSEYSRPADACCGNPIVSTSDSITAGNDLAVRYTRVPPPVRSGRPDAAIHALIRGTSRRIIPDARMTLQRPPSWILLSLAAWAAPLSLALGEEAVLRNGRTLSITDHRREGERIVLMMEGGGEIILKTMSAR